MIIFFKVSSCSHCFVATSCVNETMPMLLRSGKLIGVNPPNPFDQYRAVNLRGRMHEFRGDRVNPRNNRNNNGDDSLLGRLVPNNAPHSPLARVEVRPGTYRVTL